MEITKKSPAQRILLFIVTILLATATSAHGPIPVPLEAITRILNSRLPLPQHYSSSDIAAFPAIKDDLKLIAQQDKAGTPQAMKRLLARGRQSVPQIEQALADPATTAAAKSRLVSLLAAIGAPGAAHYIIEATEQAHTINSADARKLKFIFARAFAQLAKCDDKTDGISYANQLLEKPQTEIQVRAQAMIFLADQQIQSAARWYEKYSSPDNELSLRYASLYLGSMLGIASSKQPIIDILSNRPDKKKSHQYEESLLLRGLIEVTSPDELAKLLHGISKPGNFIDPELISGTETLAKLYKGDQQQRAEAAINLLDNWNKDIRLSLESLQYMISIKSADAYRHYWRIHHPVLRHYLNKLSYRIIVSQDKAEFSKLQGKPTATLVPDSLAKSIVESLANNDKQAFIDKLFLSKQDYLAISSPSKTTLLAPSVSYADIRDRAVASWAAAYNQAAKKGIDLDNARYQSAEYVVMVTIDGMQYSEIHISIDASGKQHKLQLAIGVLLDDKWHALSEIHWL